MICSTPTPTQNFFVNHIQRKEKITEKELFKENLDWIKNEKKLH